MGEEDSWRMEERFWIADAASCGDALDPQCIMAFASPVGIISGAAIARSLEQAPRWSSVEITDRHLAQPGSELLVLAYKARGRLGQLNGAAAGRPAIVSAAPG